MLLSQRKTSFSVGLAFDRVAVVPQSFGFGKTRIALVTVLDAVTVPVVLLDLRQAVRSLVRILDRVALRGARHGIPHPGRDDHAERREEVAFRYVADAHGVLIGRRCGTWRAPRLRYIWSTAEHHAAN